MLSSLDLFNLYNVIRKGVRSYHFLSSAKRGELFHLSREAALSHDAPIRVQTQLAALNALVSAIPFWLGNLPLRDVRRDATKARPEPASGMPRPLWPAGADSPTRRQKQKPAFSPMNWSLARYLAEEMVTDL